MITINDGYAKILHYALTRNSAHIYAFKRLKASLSEIGIDSDCQSEIISILWKIKKDKLFTSETLLEVISTFRERWEIHLNRAYLKDYENVRWKYIKDFVLNEVKGIKTSLGKCLDIGCGRGCITESIASQKYTGVTWGIDTVNFNTEWRERKSKKNGKNISFNFKHIRVENIGDWLNVQEGFDTVFLFYVLHHSNDYWAARTIREVKQYLKQGGIIVILEDSIILDNPKSDPNNLLPKWKQWTRNDQPFPLSIGFDIQVILDFVAVQLLAGFKDVSMPCNYKTGLEWLKMFDLLGLEPIKTVNIGFPNKRDIDVPQALFILGPKK